MIANSVQAAGVNMPIKPIFVYGSLMSEEVIHGLLGRVPNMRAPAFLKGYDRWRVKDNVFPAIVKSENENAFVDGILVDSLSPQELKIFDYFEDVAYERCNVKVKLGEPTKLQEVVEAQAYVWRIDLKWIEFGKDWNYKDFREESLEWYLESTVKLTREEIERLNLN